jgi:hypothetical protein
MQLRLNSVVPFNARTRNFQRLNPPGIGIHWRNRRAIADLWLSPDTVILVRFSTGKIRRWSQVSIAAGKAPSDPEQFSESLRQHLDDWFYDVLESGED